MCLLRLYIVLLTSSQEEPYKLTLMGKASIGLEVTAADFLPDGKQLYIVAADGNCDLHILQYDPERKWLKHFPRGLNTDYDGQKTQNHFVVAGCSIAAPSRQVTLPPA